MTASQTKLRVVVGVIDMIEKRLRGKVAKNVQKSGRKISDGWRSDSTILCIVRFHSRRYAPSSLRQLSLRHFNLERMRKVAYKTLVRFFIQ